jgi:hypothetical protein
VSNDDSRLIRFQGVEQGPFSIDKLYRMRKNREIDGSTEFFSKKSNEWLPLAGIIQDLDTTVSTETRLRQMKESGFKEVKLLRAGTRGECQSCRELAKGIYSIDSAPVIPPADCKCNPWCGLVFVVPE